MDNPLEKLSRTLLARIMPRPALYFDVSITEHCNLNCKGCGSFAPLADEKFMDLAEYERDAMKLSELSGGVMHHINILGGEPLLHPEVQGFLEVTRRCFPVGNIYLITNGVLVPKMDDGFWKTMRDNDIIMAPTKYPIKVDYEAIEERSRAEGVRFHYFGFPARVWYKLVLEPNGDRNENHSFMHCENANNCGCLYHGRIYPCAVIPKAHFVSEKSKYNFPVTEYDSIDIYSATLEDIMKFLAHPVPFCRFCNPFATKETDWAPSKGQVEEWLRSPL